MKPQPEPSQTSQRVKVGMIGLAAVVLLIAVASAILGSASRAPVAPAIGGQAGIATNVALANDDGVSEPLADLGVAPGTSNDQAPAPVLAPASAPVPAPAAAPTPAQVQP